MKSDIFTIMNKMQESKIGFMLKLEYEKIYLWYDCWCEWKRDLELWFDIIIEEIIKDEPNSDFAKWYNNL